eukprot:scaffold37.g4386.t1
MVVISTLVRFAQERRSNKAVESLRAMVRNTATVLRANCAAPNHADASYAGGIRHSAGPRKIEVPLVDVVPGDVVLMSAGDMIPADCRILAAKDLFVSQAALTGESLPVEKFATPQTSATSSLELHNIGFMGTNVISGSATALVIATGEATYFGELASKATTTIRTPTQFQQGINRVSWVLIRFMLFMAPLVLLVNGYTKGDWLEALLFALAIAVGLTPEMLPMIVTSTLAKEMKRALNLVDRYAKIDEIPFDFARRRMSVVVSEQENGQEHHELICKGALDEMLQVCGYVKTVAGLQPLDAAARADIRRITDELNGEGLRVIAVGVKELPPVKNTYQRDRPYG